MYRSKIAGFPSHPSFPQTQYCCCSPFPYSLCHSCGHYFTLIYTFNTLVLKLSVLSLSINSLVQGYMTPRVHCKSADCTAHSVHDTVQYICTLHTAQLKPVQILSLMRRDETLVYTDMGLAVCNSRRRRIIRLLSTSILSTLVSLNNVNDKFELNVENMHNCTCHI